MLWRSRYSATYSIDVLIYYHEHQPVPNYLSHCRLWFVDFISTQKIHCGPLYSTSQPKELLCVFVFVFVCVCVWSVVSSAGSWGLRGGLSGRLNWSIKTVNWWGSLLRFPFLLLPMFARMPGWKGAHEGRRGSARDRLSLWTVCVKSPPSAGRPVNLILYMPFSIFAYSSKIYKADFERMDSMLACGILKNSKFGREVLFV